jgi:hypothetical protein
MTGTPWDIIVAIVAVGVLSAIVYNLIYCKSDVEAFTKPFQTSSTSTPTLTLT